MRRLRRQWYRVQLARELLRAYEYEEAHRIGWTEALRRIQDMPDISYNPYRRNISKWREAVEAKADQYPSG